MEYLKYIIFVLVILLIISRMLPTKGVRQISTLELKKELTNKNKQFIDVRTPGEFHSRNIRGFINIPL